ncbi:MAG: ATPase, partial [Deltaproteobacteria bacterium]|nr:ATPase [Deltaproteobacteria bacterium]
TVESIQPLKERIGIKYHLQPLDSQNTLKYIVFKLKAAGTNRGIFSREAALTIYRHSGGIPLKINNICDLCLLIGSIREARLIDSKIVNEAIEEIR